MIHIPPCAVATAPADGRVRDVAALDTTVVRGEVVAVLETTAGRREVTAPSGGRVGGRLADPSQPVTAGEGVLWLSRR